MIVAVHPIIYSTCQSSAASVSIDQAAEYRFKYKNNFLILFRDWWSSVISQTIEALKTKRKQEAWWNFLTTLVNSLVAHKTKSKNRITALRILAEAVSRDWKCLRDWVSKNVTLLFLWSGNKRVRCTSQWIQMSSPLVTFKCLDTLSSSAERLGEPFLLVVRQVWFNIISVAVPAEGLLEGYCLFLLRSWWGKKRKLRDNQWK